MGALSAGASSVSPKAERRSMAGASKSGSASMTRYLPPFLARRISRASASKAGATMPSDTSRLSTMARERSTRSLTAATSP